MWRLERVFRMLAALVAVMVGVALGTPSSTEQQAVIFAGAGDIASCYDDNDEATARLLGGIEGHVFALGDNVYDDGSHREFASCYDPTWGRHRDRTWPVPGNHDYHTPGADAYFDYFGGRAGDPDKGYYSFDLGAWHVVALNTNCGEIGGCGDDSPQLVWLRADLAANPGRCTLALAHHPRFSTGGHAGDEDVSALWRAMYEGGTELVLSGHEHNYERFTPQDPDGNADPERGIVQFIVGTGGAPLREFVEDHPNSEARSSDAFGVLKLTLHLDRYEWEFVPVEGQAFTDTGSATCH